MLYGIAAALAALFLSAALAALAATAARRFVAPRGRGGPRPVAPWFGGLAVALATCAVGAAGRRSASVRSARAPARCSPPGPPSPRWGSPPTCGG
ncbi:hypothetical protein GCM10020256_35020 [Streptomyces thermocoprophilus]